MGPHAEAILALAVVFGVAGVVAMGLTFLRRRRRRFSGDEPACGECGYIVHPRARRVCPECGADLAAVGVFTPATEPPAFPLLSAYGASLFLLVVAALFGPALARLTPLGWQFHAWHVVDTSKTKPLSRYNYAGQFKIDVRGTGRSWGRSIERFHIDYVDPAKVGKGGPAGVVVVVNPRDRTCRVYRGWPTGPAPVPLGEDELRTAAGAAGFDDVEGAALAARLGERVDQFLRHELPPESSAFPFTTPAGTEYRPVAAAAWVAGAFIWAAGMGAFVWQARRLHRRRRERAAAAARQLLEDLRLVPDPPGAAASGAASCNA